jgi:DNA-binding transcriptional LysR family regulator
MSQFDEMQMFVRIVDAGSISKAADQLGVAKSGVSRRLSDLERRLGVKLINRTTRRSSLTEAGTAYYRGAVALLANVAELDASVASSETRLEGVLRVAVPLSFGLGHLAPAIREFIAANPAVDVHIDFSDRRIDLVAQGMELGIRIANLEDSSLQARRICPIRMVLCASPDYLSQHGTPRSPEDLATHRLLHYDGGSGQPLRLAGADGKARVVRAQPRVTANNGDFLCGMAAAGFGVCLIPTFIAWQALRAGELVALLDDHPQPALAAWAVYPRNRYLSRRARALIDFLVERFGERPYWDGAPDSAR